VTLARARGGWRLHIDTLDWSGEAMS
jgi:hypothetical protein